MKFKYKNALINYQIIGQGYPIICLHGMQCDLTLMTNSLEPVFNDSKHYQRIYLDFLGMGHSNAPLEFASSDGILEVMIAFINEVVGPQRFSLIGESYGGYICFGLLTKFKEMIDQVLLIVPAVLPDKKQRILPAKEDLSYDLAFLATLDNDIKKHFLNHATIANEQTYQLYLEQFNSGIERSNREYVFKILKNYPYSFDLNEYFKNNYIKSFITFIVGKQDIVVGYQDQFAFMQLFENSAFYVVNNAGHNLQIEQVATFNKLVEIWLLNLNFINNIKED